MSNSGDGDQTRLRPPAVGVRLAATGLVLCCMTGWAVADPHAAGQASTTNVKGTTADSQQADAGQAPGNVTVATVGAGQNGLLTEQESTSRTEDGATSSELPGTPTISDGTDGWDDVSVGLQSLLGPERFSETAQFAATMIVFSLAPAVLLMTTCYVRIMIVLTLLRQALGLQQVPPNQVLTTVALFLTFLIMSPVWTRVHQEAIVPYTEQAITSAEAWQAAMLPIRQFMSQQIDNAHNGEEIWLFLDRLPATTPTPQNYDDVPLRVLLPAYLLSELKVAFLIGFQVFLPFVIIDVVVSAVTISTGMFMLPPMTVSLPLKLMLFVLVDGWHLIVGMLLESFGSVA